MTDSRLIHIRYSALNMVQLGNDPQIAEVYIILQLSEYPELLNIELDSFWQKVDEISSKK